MRAPSRIGIGAELIGPIRTCWPGWNNLSVTAGHHMADKGILMQPFHTDDD